MNGQCDTIYLTLVWQFEVFILLYSYAIHAYVFVFVLLFFLHLVPIYPCIYFLFYTHTRKKVEISTHNHTQSTSHDIWVYECMYVCVCVYGGTLHKNIRNENYTMYIVVQKPLWNLCKLRAVNRNVLIKSHKKYI